jgi:hypothetical protein
VTSWIQPLEKLTAKGILGRVTNRPLPTRMGPGVDGVTSSFIIQPVYIKHANEADIIRARGVGVVMGFPTGRRL